MNSFAARSLPVAFAATVASLHRVAERIVSPSRKPDSEIALAATSQGFGTPEFDFDGARQRVRVEGAELVREVDGVERRTPLTSLAAASAIVSDLLPHASELDAEPLEVDIASSLLLGDLYGLGATALDRLAGAADPTDAATPPRLWPEHFDIAIELGCEADGARANYGLSPGDENHPEPYLYVGPWTADVTGELWEATGFRGAELGYAALLGAPDPFAAACDFFAERRAALATNQRSHR